MFFRVSFVYNLIKEIEWKFYATVIRDEIFFLKFFDEMVNKKDFLRIINLYNIFIALHIYKYYDNAKTNKVLIY